MVKITKNTKQSVTSMGCGHGLSIPFQSSLKIKKLYHFKVLINI